METRVTVATFCSLSGWKREAGGVYLTGKQANGEGRRQKGHGNGFEAKKEGVSRGCPEVALLFSQAAPQLVSLQARGNLEFSQNGFPCPNPAFVKAWRDSAGAATHGGGILLAWRTACTTSVHLLPAHKNLVPIFPAHQEGQRVTTEPPAHHFPDAGK